MRILPDAHAHIGTDAELRERKEQKIPTLLCGTKPEQMERLMAICGEVDSMLIPTCGLHPWYADRNAVTAMEAYFNRCSIVGEIGMDSVWCEVPRSTQQTVFEAQLQFAMDKQKPVILHTKGMEGEIGALIATYPNTYLVHWYSSFDYLELYLKLDCYVSIGPDVWWNEAVQQVARQIPNHRLLIETDGMEAVRWAYEEGAALFMKNSNKSIPVMPKTVQQALAHTLKTTAEIREVEEAWLAEQVWENFRRFCCI